MTQSEQAASARQKPVLFLWAVRNFQPQPEGAA